MRTPSFWEHIGWRLGLLDDPWEEVRKRRVAMLDAIERECARACKALEMQEAFAVGEWTAGGLRRFTDEERAARIAAWRLSNRGEGSA